MIVFVTGGSGFIGGHVIERLVANGHRVRAMARSDRSAEAVTSLGATPVRCGLHDVQQDHLASCDAVVHCAAFVEEYGPRDAFWQANVEGTQRVLDAAQAADVGRFVHIGTEAALFDGHDLLDIDETHPVPARQRFLYSETKAEAERRVLAVDRPGFRTLSLRPRLVWGPRDGSVLPAIIAMAQAGRWSWLDKGAGRTSTTHVHNLAHAVVLAVDADIGGTALFVADAGQTTLRAFLTRLANTRGVALPDRSMPGALARPLSRLVEGAWRLLRLPGTPPLVAFSVHMMSRSVTVRWDRAAQVLGYEPIIDRDTGLAQLAATA